MFYNESKSIKIVGSQLGADTTDLYKRIPASGLIEDRLKYARRKNKIKTREVDTKSNPTEEGKFI